MSFPIQPSGTPPMSAPANLLSLPYFNCINECEWIPTAVVIDGPNYEYKRRGVDAFPGGMTLSMRDGGNRLYLVNPQGDKHHPFYVKNRQVSIDIDLSQVKCGYNAAFYFVNMDLNAPLGTGYCDGQGTCQEYDLMEANRAATQATTHSCTGGNNCDHWGCGVNNKLPVFGPGGQIDTNQPFTITSTFRTKDGTDSGDLVSIEQQMIQQGRIVKTTTIRDDYCYGLGNADPQFPSTGGLSQLSKALEIGMTPTFCIWGDGGESMAWLDGGQKNPACALDQEQLRNEAKFSNLRIGRIQ